MTICACLVFKCKQHSVNAGGGTIIKPNLMVRAIASPSGSTANTIGKTLRMIVSSAREVGWPGKISGLSFATLEGDQCRRMLLTVASVADVAKCGLDRTDLPSHPEQSNSAASTPIPRTVASPRGSRHGIPTEQVRHD